MKQISLRLPDGMVERIDAVRHPAESRNSWVARQLDRLLVVFEQQGAELPVEPDIPLPGAPTGPFTGINVELSGGVSLSPCEEWAGQTDRHGYGRVFVDGKYRGAHRVAYEKERGAIPDGLEIDHLCRNRRCVRVDHLEAVTHRENMLRSETPVAENARKTHCVEGHPFDEENTRVRPNGDRRCKQCERDKKNEKRRGRARGSAQAQAGGTDPEEDRLAKPPAPPSTSPPIEHPQRGPDLPLGDPEKRAAFDKLRDDIAAGRATAPEPSIEDSLLKGGPHPEDDEPADSEPVYDDADPVDDPQAAANAQGAREQMGKPKRRRRK